MLREKKKRIRKSTSPEDLAFLDWLEGTEYQGEGIQDWNDVLKETEEDPDDD